MKSLLALVLAALIGVPVRAGLLDEVTIKGVIDIGDVQQRYILRVTYAPQPAQPHYPNLPKHHRLIKRIEVFIGGRPVRFPPKAYADLWFAHRVWPMYEAAEDTAFFDLEGGDASASYTVRFTVNGRRLVRRELERHAEKPEITVYK